MDPKKGRINHISKSIILLLAYMHRVELPKELDDSAKEIVLKTPKIIELWLELALQFHFQFRVGRARKNMTFKSIANILRFSQFATQGLWESDSPLLQLPHIDKDSVAKICKKMQK